MNVRQGEQKSESFLELNPNAKVPVLTDTDRAIVLSESAAILVYLAEKHGKLLSQNPVTRARTFEQLFVHASGLSPAFGQAGYFQKFSPEHLPLAIERFVTEAKRQLSLLDGVLERGEFVAGNDFSIADIAHFGWIWRRGFPDLTLDDVPNVQRWYEAVQHRPAVVMAIEKVESLVPLAA
ncbi:Disulfide-bond oxidoreductase YfcG [compost metagenome]